MITNSFGQVVLKTIVGSKERDFELDCSKYAIGLYYVTISNSKIHQKTKFVVIR